VFGQIEAGLGLIPGAGGVQHLTRQMGRHRAMEVILSADDYSADEAERYGWINRAVTDAELEPFVSKLAARVALFPKAGLKAIKDGVNEIALPHEEALRADNEQFPHLVKDSETEGRRKALARARQANEMGVELGFGRTLGRLL
jgi:enoyl-CoA hydratase/carnithine racemase